MNSVRFYCFVLALTVFVSACEVRQRPEPVQKLRIKKLVRILPNSAGITNVSSLSYDSQNRLMSVLSYQVPDSSASIVGRTSYEYDSQNRLSVVTRSVHPYGSEQYNYSYNPDGLVTTLDYDAGNLEVYQVTFNYIGNVLNHSLRKFKYFYALAYTGDFQYTFTGLNLSTITVIQTIDKVIPAVSTYSVTLGYDDKINPFYGTCLIPAPVLPARPTFGQFSYYTYCGGYDNMNTFSKNNIASESKSTGEQNKFTYTYNESGYPVTRLTFTMSKPQGEPVLQETLAYEYENY